EENSRIGELDTYVLRKVCELHTRWEQLKYPRLPISVNVSRVHAMTHQFIEKYDGILNEYDIPKNLIEIELTETAFSNDPDKVIETVGKLRALGFSISLDDFGTGYSSLNLLKDLKVDIIKIDRLFLKDFASESRSEIIIRHVLNLADDLGMVVVAEGVESEMQLKFLLSVGCHQAQGFLLAEPMPIDTFLEYWHPSVSR
ncbi:MAG: EAL domain-containing protein, partial [Sphaerochaeta sp.]|nr:EAL domain-containing protein [Sphaerochaeta sp.]